MAHFCVFDAGHLSRSCDCAWIWNHQLKHHLELLNHSIDPWKFTKMPCKNHVTKVRNKNAQKARNAKVQRPQGEFCQLLWLWFPLTASADFKNKIKMKCSFLLMDPFQHVVLRLARGRRKPTWRSNMIVLRLLSNQHWTISIPFCRRHRNLQQKQRRISHKNGPKDMKANSREP